MKIPPFEVDGNLPPGIHPASLEVVAASFGTGSTQREMLWQRLNDVYNRVAATGKLARFVIFGSFVTSKLEPNDIDLFIMMEDDFDIHQIDPITKIIFQHAAAQAHIGASIFWSTRSGAFGGEQAMIEYWQIRRDGGFRGIVEITEGRQ